ncbi:low molecular weight protein-tyrosine-phosphatase [Sinimarinibacterium sp. NLF-5-8]|uniref:low molecular weight protein-tyrosine-phosphatase n=1 Tax=Sinimarinibacterium sp. NLF-5-8 TaxID=2698684 RepID=UPI00137BF1D5|nr:low molecular weight protein-tyrosine-phosphatase [Sinimarinibacterium sp. NLF-5-8]QHS10025.1 low molecular weight phosphotyrosine protein phosphatase [Sinimarinibacterium sp. NLF-5-8]
MFNNIAVICTGNICRSPLGEYLLRARLGARVEQVISAGTGALVGAPADELSLEVGADNGLDLSAHRAQQATAALLSGMDLILTLDQSHSDWLNHQFPQLRGRIHKFMKWRGNADIADPYRLPKAAFQKAFEEIAQGVDDWSRKI